MPGRISEANSNALSSGCPINRRAAKSPVQGAALGGSVAATKSAHQIGMVTFQVAFVGLVSQKPSAMLSGITVFVSEVCQTLFVSV